VAHIRDSLVGVHGSGVGPESVNGIVTEHAAAAGHEIVTGAIGTVESVSLEVVRVHKPVSLVDVIRVTKCGVARGGGAIGVVAHVGLVDVGTRDIIDVGVAEVVEIIVDPRASLCWKCCQSVSLSTP